MALVVVLPQSVARMTLMSSGLRFMNRLPAVGTVILAFIVITVILSAVWLAIGIKERAFFSAWNNRFNRFISLKERIDRELEEGTGGEGQGKGSEKRDED